jgi:hypothetical protein
MSQFSPTRTVRYHNLIENDTCHVAGRLVVNKLEYFWIPLRICKTTDLLVNLQKSSLIRT